MADHTGYRDEGGYRDDLLTYGEDYDLTRYATWSDPEAGELARDAEGHVIWHEGWPTEGDWNDVGMVTVNFDPGGEGKYRNIPISPDEPLDPFGKPGEARDPDYFYDLDDLASQYDWAAWSP